MISVLISSQSIYKFDRERMRRAVERTVAAAGIGGEVTVSLAVVGNRKMRELHKKYMETDETTDVLSFPLEERRDPEGVLWLGDIVVCYPVVMVQAGENNRLVDEEMEFLVEHGTKHLLGIHHE